MTGPEYVIEAIEESDKLTRRVTNARNRGKARVPFSSIEPNVPPREDS
jgi:hypothetical protein